MVRSYRAAPGKVHPFMFGCSFKIGHVCVRAYEMNPIGFGSCLFTLSGLKAGGFGRKPDRIYKPCACKCDRVYRSQTFCLFVLITGYGLTFEMS